MANIFNQLATYGKEWTLESSRAFNSEELGVIERAEMSVNKKGFSVVCCHLVGGGVKYLNPSRDSQAVVGQEVSLENSQLIKLVRTGDEPRTMIVANPAATAGRGGNIESGNIFGVPTPAVQGPAKQVVEDIPTMQEPATAAPQFDMAGLAALIGKVVKEEVAKATAPKARKPRAKKVADKKSAK